LRPSGRASGGASSAAPVAGWGPPKHPSYSPGSLPAPLCRDFAALCTQLAALDRRLQGPLGSQGTAMQTAGLQLSAGCRVLSAAWQAARACRFDATTITECSAAAVLLVGSGRRHLEAQLRGASAPGVHPLLLHSSHTSMARYFSLLTDLLGLQQGNDACLAAFARSALPAKQLLPWLLVATRMLAVLASPHTPGVPHAQGGCVIRC